MILFFSWVWLIMESSGLCQQRKHDYCNSRVSMSQFFQVHLLHIVHLWSVSKDTLEEAFPWDSQSTCSPCLPLDLKSRKCWSQMASLWKWKVHRHYRGRDGRSFSQSTQTAHQRYHWSACFCRCTDYQSRSALELVPWAWSKHDPSEMCARFIRQLSQETASRAHANCTR